MAKIQGTKFWLRWSNYSVEPWSRLWHIKYARDRPKNQLVRLNEYQLGSPIWMKVVSGWRIVQEHYFWDIRDGESEKFWEDSWN